MVGVELWPLQWRRSTSDCVHVLPFRMFGRIKIYVEHVA